jgi:electron transport complex protein RnfE
MSSKKRDIVLNGILKENPSLRLVLGTCPTLAVTTLAINGLGMGLSATFVLICSGIAISALRNVIPSKVRLPAYITIIAAFVTLLMMLVKAYLPELNTSLGVYLPLIVVNCIILGRAESFAYKNGVLASAVDGICQGIGYTAVLIVMSVIRELLGAGTFGGGLLGADAKGIQIIPSQFPIGMLTLPVGGFLVLGCLIAAMQWALAKSKNKEERK